MAETNQFMETMRDKLLGKEFYVILSKAEAPREEIVKIMPEHFHYQIDLEKSGTLFAAGPLADRDGPTRGLIVVRAASFDEAEKIANSDPLHKAGLRSFTLEKWTVNEGNYTLTVNYSDQSVTIG